VQMSLAAAPLYGSCRPKRSLGGSRATPVRWHRLPLFLTQVAGCTGTVWFATLLGPITLVNRIRYYTKNVRWSVHMYLLGLYRFGWSALILHSHLLLLPIDRPVYRAPIPYCCEDDVGAIRNLAIDFNGFFSYEHHFSTVSQCSSGLW